MTRTGRWTRFAVAVVLLPASAWLLVMSVAPQFGEYALEGVLVWVSVALAFRVFARVSVSIATTRSAPSEFDSFIGPHPIVRVAVAQMVNADRLAALAADAGVFGREIAPLLEAVSDGDFDADRINRLDALDVGQLSALIDRVQTSKAEAR